MLAHHSPLIGVEGAGFPKHVIRDPQLADVVEERDLFRGPYLVFRKRETARDLLDETYDRLGVLAGVAVMRIEGSE